jgi:hypothetical protein
MPAYDWMDGKIEWGVLGTVEEPDEISAEVDDRTERSLL